MISGSRIALSHEKMFYISTHAHITARVANSEPELEGEHLLSGQPFQYGRASHFPQDTPGPVFGRMYHYHAHLPPGTPSQRRVRYQFLTIRTNLTVTRHSTLSPVHVTVTRLCIAINNDFPALHHVARPHALPCTSSVPPPLCVGIPWLRGHHLAHPSPTGATATLCLPPLSFGFYTRCVRRMHRTRGLEIE
jgi:hypothetical protein